MNKYIKAVLVMQLLLLIQLVIEFVIEHITSIKMPLIVWGIILLPMFFSRPKEEKK